MSVFRYFCPIEVRYADLDPQGHVNNAKFLSYMEHARARYLQHLGLWDGRSFLDIGIILADVQVAFKAPILYGQPVQVGMHVTHLGNKSLQAEYRLEDAETGQLFATGKAVLVAYDYHTSTTIPVPQHWREVIQAFERLA